MEWTSIYGESVNCCWKNLLNKDLGNKIKGKGRQLHFNLELKRSILPVCLPQKKLSRVIIQNLQLPGHKHEGVYTLYRPL